MGLIIQGPIFKGTIIFTSPGSPSSEWMVLHHPQRLNPWQTSQTSKPPGWSKLYFGSIFPLQTQKIARTLFPCKSSNVERMSTLSSTQDTNESYSNSLTYHNPLIQKSLQVNIYSSKISFWRFVFIFRCIESTWTFGKTSSPSWTPTFRPTSRPQPPNPPQSVALRRSQAVRSAASKFASHSRRVAP